MNILAPFDDGQQNTLKLVDAACQSQMRALQSEATRQKISGEPLHMDAETAGWVQIITAYGILYNRAIDAGWIQDIHLDKLPEKNDG